jgi:cytochrome P450
VELEVFWESDLPGRIHTCRVPSGKFPIAAEEAGELLTDAELRSLVITLMSAGHGTVQHQLGNAMSAFMAHPQQWRLLAAEPALAAQAADEVVRFCPSALLGLPRIAKAGVEVNGVEFAAGSCVLPITGSANRDASVFEAADTLDISCKRLPHLTYGGGIHYCLGAALARVELQEALPLLASLSCLGIEGFAAVGACFYPSQRTSPAPRS